MKYEELPYYFKNAVENCEMGCDYASDCLEAALTICKDEEGAIRALMLAYGEWVHMRESALEILKKAGYTEEQINKYRYEYREKYRDVLPLKKSDPKPTAADDAAKG